MHVDVDAYAGFKADERPLRFRLSGREYAVTELLDKWYGPSDTWFKVLADDGCVYILKLSADSQWTLESFRAKPSPQEQAPAPAGEPPPSEDKP